MSEPVHISKIVGRVLRGFDPDQEDAPCRKCGKPTSDSDPGAQDGYCPSCAAEKRRTGEWHTPSLIPSEQEQCPVCSHYTQYVAGDLDDEGLLVCGCGRGASIVIGCKCVAQFRPGWRS